MTTLTLRFTLHRAFVSDGVYDVYVGGKKATIEVRREKNSSALQKIYPKFSILNPSDLFVYMEL